MSALNYLVTITTNNGKYVRIHEDLNEATEWWRGMMAVNNKAQWKIEEVQLTRVRELSSEGQ